MKPQIRYYSKRDNNGLEIKRALSILPDPDGAEHWAVTSFVPGFENEIPARTEYAKTLTEAKWKFDYMHGFNIHMGEFDHVGTLFKQ